MTPVLAHCLYYLYLRSYDPVHVKCAHYLFNLLPYHYCFISVHLMSCQGFLSVPNMLLFFVRLQVLWYVDWRRPRFKGLPYDIWLFICTVCFKIVGNLHSASKHSINNPHRNLEFTSFLWLYNGGAQQQPWTANAQYKDSIENCITHQSKKVLCSNV